MTFKSITRRATSLLCSYMLLSLSMPVFGSTYPPGPPPFSSELEGVKQVATPPVMEDAPETTAEVVQQEEQKAFDRFRDQYEGLAKIYIDKADHFYTNTLGTLEDENSLHSRIINKTTNYKEPWYRWDQDYEVYYEQLEQEYKDFEMAFANANSLRDTYFERAINNQRLSAEERRAILIVYIQRIYLPMRKLSLIMNIFPRNRKKFTGWGSSKTYRDTYKTFIESTNELLFKVPSDLVENYFDQLDIEQGPGITQNLVAMAPQFAQFVVALAAMPDEEAANLDPNVAITRSLYRNNPERLEPIINALQSNDETVYVELLRANPNTVKVMFAQLGMNYQDQSMLPHGFELIEDGDQIILGDDYESRIYRDIAYLLTAPTGHTFLRAMKWFSLNTMVSQIRVDKNLLLEDESTSIQIPESCSIDDNGNMPTELPYEFEDMEAKYQFFRTMIDAGVITAPVADIPLQVLGLKQDDLPKHDEMNFYRNQVEEQIDHLASYPSLDLEFGNINGTSIFEDYEMALFATEAVYDLKEAPLLDFNNHYLDIMSSRIQKMNPIVEEYISPTIKKFVDDYGDEYEIQDEPIPAEIVEEMKKALSPYTPQEGQGFEIPINNQKVDVRGYTQLLVEKMIEKKTANIYDVIPQELKDKLQEKTLIYEFPPYFSPDPYKRLILSMMYEGIIENRDTLVEAYKLTEGKSSILSVPKVMKDKVQKAVWLHNQLDLRLRNYKPKKELKYDSNRDRTFERMMRVFDKTIALINDHSVEHDVLPRHFLYNDDLLEFWPNLKFVYDFMVEKELIDEYSYSAYWYLSNEILYDNPFAILYASFHTLRSELSSNYHKVKLDALGRLVGLTNDFTPLFMQKVVESKDEVKRLWRNIRNRYESANNFLYTQTSNEVELNDISWFDYSVLGKSYIEKPYTYYELIKDVFDTPLLDKNDIVGKSNLMFPTIENGVQMGRELRELAPDYYDKEIFKSVTDLKEVYKEKDKSKREELANEYLAKWDPNHEYSVKRHFIQADFYAKFPLYQKLTKSSVAQQKVNMRKALERLCEKNDYEIEQYREIFYSVAKMQDSINQVFGDQQLPPMVNDRLNGIHEEEKNVMKYGLLMLPAFILSAVAAPMTGGASLAAFGGLVLMATGATSLGYLGYKTIKHSTNNLYENKEMYHQMKFMQEIGFTDGENLKEFHRKWAPLLVVVDTFFLLPIVHYVSNMVRITYKSLIDLTELRIKGIRHSNFSHVLTNSSNAVNLENSLMTLEFFGGWEQTKNALRFMRDSVKKAVGIKTHVKGISSPWKANSYRAAMDIPSQAALKSKTVNTVSKYFKGSLFKFSRMIARYVKPKKLQSLRTRRDKLKILSDAQIERGSRWYNRLYWNYAARLEKVEKKIKLREKWEEILNLAKDYEKQGKSLDQFLTENFELVTELKNLTFKKRELPHFFLLQGLPMDNRRFPLYERLIEGYMTKRFFLAYDNVASELARQNAIAMLKIPQKETMYRTYDFMMQFHADVTKMIKVRPGFQNYDTLYDQFQEQIIKNVNNNFYQRIKNQITNPEINAIFKNRDRLRQVLFNPKNTKEKEIARAIWNMQNPANLYKDEYLTKMARHALDELHGETNLDDFEIYMRAAKVLFGSKRPEMLL